MMVTFFVIWLLGMGITTGTLMWVCRGQEINKSEILTGLVAILIWPAGFPAILCAIFTAWYDKLSKDEDKVFRFPGGKKK